MILQKDSFKEMFIFETNDLIRQIEEIIMENESAGSFKQSGVNAVFRIMHTIKGSASMMGMQNIAALTHAVEDLFEYIRTDNTLAQDANVMDIVLESVDFIRGEVDKLSEGQASDGDASGFVKKANNMLNMFRNPDSAQKTDEQPEQDNQNTQESGFAPQARYKANVVYEENSGMESLRAFMLMKDLEDVAEIVSYFPEDIPDEACEDEIKEKGFQIYFDSSKSYEELQEFFNDIVFAEQVTLTKNGEQKVDVAKEAQLPQNLPQSPPPIPPLQDLPQPPPPPPPRDLPQPLPSPSPLEQTPVQNQSVTQETAKDTLPLDDSQQNCKQESRPADVIKQKTVRSAMVHVSVDKLDELMNLVGELVISGMMVSGELLADETGEEVRDRRESLCYHHEKTIADLQDIAISLRMVPVSVTFHKMRRVVRDMCRKLGIDINIQVIGEDTEIDKNVLDNISDPLLHLVRNAVDHGIGSVEERIAAGKTKNGNIVIEARNVGSDVWFIVKDDGQGLNRGKIYKRALEKGIVNKPEDEMTDAEIFSYIFNPGFSTSDNVTEFSGRGVGLDVVNQNISQIGGNILVESTEGRGSTFIIKVPVTLAIIAGLAFKVGDSKYALPISAVRECIEVTGEDLILDPKGNEAVIIREECYPILRLHKRYGIDTKVTDIADGILIVIDTEYVQYCLFADELIGEQQVVVKSLPKWVDKRIKGISGCTLLGDGSISLILEAASLVE